MRTNDQPQLQILHLSDIHVGSNFVWDHVTPAGDTITRGDSGLAKSILRDFSFFPDHGNQVLICTGDFAEVADKSEFKRAAEELRELSKGLGFDSSKLHERVFFTCGNHDVEYSESEIQQRISNYRYFLEQFFGSAPSLTELAKGVFVHDLRKEFDAVICEVNTSLCVEKGKIDANRGSVTENQIQLISSELETIGVSPNDSCLKICICHHHPVLLPILSEPGRGYDAINLGGQLLARLRKLGFRVVLHGHKHLPVALLEDTTIGLTRIENKQMYIVAGGSASSKELPSNYSENTFNHLVVRHNSATGETRISHDTYALETKDENGEELLHKEKYWKVKRHDDRLMTQVGRWTHHNYDSFEYSDALHQNIEKERLDQYKLSGHNFAVAEVRPSMIVGQGYEVRLSLKRHFKVDGDDRKSVEWRADSPEAVTWYAGPKYKVCKVKLSDCPEFSMVYNIYGPVLVRAEMEFKDGSKRVDYVYVPFPEGQ